MLMRLSAMTPNRPTRLAVGFRTPSICLRAREAVRPHTVTVEPRRGNSPPAIESMDDRYWRSPRLRGAGAACATCVDLRMAVRAVAPLWKLYVPARRQRERGSGIDRPLAALGGSMTSELRRYTVPIANRTNTRQGP